MKEAPGKFGGNFLGTMVRICDACNFIGSNLYGVFFSHCCHFIEQLERPLKLVILIPRLLLSG